MTPIEEPQPAPTIEQPLPCVWVVFAAVISFICFGSLVAIVRPPGMDEDQLRIHRILSSAEMDQGISAMTPNKEAIDRAIAELKALSIEDPAAKGTRARALVVLRHLSDPKTAPNFSGLTDDFGDSDDALTRSAESKEDIAKANEARRKLVGTPNLTDQDREAAAKTLAELGARWPLDAAARGPVNAQTVTTEAMLGAFAFLGVLLIGTGCLAWVVMSKGINQVPLAGTAATGDNLGARFLVFMLVFSFAGSAIAAVLAGSSFTMVAVTGTLALTMFAIIGLTIKGRSFNSRQIGLRSDNLRLDIAYGVAAFFANIPVLIILILAGMFLLRWIPSGGHPLQYEMFSSNIVLVVLAVGPLTGFVEEVAFRGFLFQGLALRWGMWPGLLLSSLGFAMIHPQGGALWLVLGWIGGMGAYLTYKRRSLIPAIIMHAIHNSAIVLLIWSIYR